MIRPTPPGEIFGRLAEPFTGEGVFDCLAGVVYFVKNERAEYVIVNRTLAVRCGGGDKARLLGRTAAQVFPAPLGPVFWQQDVDLLKTGKPVTNQLELHVYPNGDAGWCLTDKQPLRDAAGAVIGVVGVSQDLHAPDESAGVYEDVAAAVRYARDHLDRRIVAADLAREAGLSAYQFDARIRQLFRLTTGQLLLKLRMGHAADQLSAGDRPVGMVALSCGYGDQSAFARQFRRTTGLTPVEYRRAHRPGGRAVGV